jgi:hypothetical protein
VLKSVVGIGDVDLSPARGGLYPFLALPTSLEDNPRVSTNASSRALLVLRIWASRSPAHASISGPINGILGVESVISWRPELPAFLAAFPRPPMPILIVGITQAKALMLDLASSPASKRYKGGIATYPLLTTRRCDQRRFGIAAKPTMLAGNRRGFHPVVRHALPLLDGGRMRSALCSVHGCITSWIILCSGLICGPICPRHGWGPSGCALRDAS